MKNKPFNEVEKYWLATKRILLSKDLFLNITCVLMTLSLVFIIMPLVLLRQYINFGIAVPIAAMSIVAIYYSYKYMRFWWFNNATKVRKSGKLIRFLADSISMISIPIISFGLSSVMICVSM